MLRVPIAHLARIGTLAAREQHELGNAFRSAGRTMLEQARTHKEVVGQHGLSK